MFTWTNIESIILPICLVVIISISLFIGFLLKNKSEKIRNLPCTVVISIMLILEIIKLILSIINKSLDTWQIPLHFCSMFLVWFALAQFTKGSVKRAGQTLSFVCSVLFLLLFYINPGDILGNSTADFFKNFYSFHSFTFHQLVILFFVLMLTCRVYKPQKKDIKYVCIYLTIYFVVGVTCANLLDTNYCNFLSSSIPFMESWRLISGQVVYLLTMYGFGMSVGISTIYLSSLIFKQNGRKKE